MRTLAVLLIFCWSLAVAQPVPPVVVLSQRGVVGPANADYLQRGFDKAVKLNAQLVVLTMDTPGGLDLSMRTIIENILALPIPVASQTLRHKQTNDAAAYIRGLAELHRRNAEWADKAGREAVSLSAQEALKLKVIDMIADDVPQLLRPLDGRKLTVLGQERRLATVAAETLEIQPDRRTRLLSVITDPGISYVLLMIGFFGLLFEFFSPGLVAPGVIGGVSLLLVLFALQLLPVSYTGLALIALGVGLLVAKRFAPGFRLLGLGCITAFVIGSIMLINTGSDLNPTPALQPAPPSTVGSDRILNSDGTVKWTEYEKVAKNYNTDEMLKYRFGPGYSAYHSANDPVGSLPQSGNNGIDGPGDKRIIAGPSNPWSDWFAMSGQLAYVPDNAGDPGMARANNGSVYCDSNDKPVFDYRVSSSPDYSNPWQQPKDPAILQPNWNAPSVGTAPSVPVAVARSRYMTSVAGIAIFANGLIGVTSTGNDPNTVGLGNFPAIRLPAGKVPTAIALTLNHEFALVTIWDTVNHKGQLAVIALEGNPPGVPSGPHFLGKVWWWGLPNWPAVKAIKLLGYVDLPVAAPTSIEATEDVSVESGRNYPDNLDMDLSDQTQRDDWYGNKGRLRRSAHSGLAVIASRAEGKAVFVDLQPLFQYYRNMYFTSAARNQATTNVGPGDNQWPYTFANTPEQMPKVASTIDVPRPTSVAAGYFRGHEQPWSIWDSSLNSSTWDDGSFARTAYIATEAGEMRLYDVGNLNSENASKPTPTLTRSVNVGNNPIAISYGNQAWFAKQNNLYVLTRGDKGLVQLRSNGDVVKSVTDSRMVDPVNLGITYNYRGGCGGYASLAVLDYAGKQVHNYIPGRRLASDANGGGEDLSWLFGYSTQVPGRPYLFSTAEVM